MSSQKVIETQIALAEKLQLLHEVSYSDGVDISYQRVSTSDTRADIRALDLIVVCLATGRDGDVVAAAFDKSAGLRLILAKNGQPTAQDIAATENFLASVATAVGWVDVVPFICKHSMDNVIHRISQLHRSLSTFHPHLTISSIDRKNALDKEFPKSKCTREELYGAETPSFEVILSDMIGRCLDLSATAASGSISATKWIDLIYFSDILRRSLVLQELIDDKTPAHSERKANADRLKRRLAKVCQYRRLNSLITKVKKWFPDGNIPFHWVDDKYDRSGEGNLAPDLNPMAAISRRQRNNEDLSQPSPLQPGEIAAVEKRFPSLIANWEKWRTVHPCVHAEIRVILHLDSSKKLPPYSMERGPQQAVSCSKRSCLCCQIWISTFNRYSQREWMTSGSCGKPYSNWAFPGHHGWMGPVDATVDDQVTVELARSFSWLDKGSNRYDEYTSSGSDSEDSENGRPVRDVREMLAMAERLDAEGIE